MYILIYDIFNNYKIKKVMMDSDIVHRLGYVVFIHGSGVRLPVSENIFEFLL